MVKDNRSRLQREKQKIRESGIDSSDKEKILELLEAYDGEIIHIQATNEHGEKVTKEAATLNCYAVNLRTASRRLDGKLTTASADDVNRLIQSLYDGSHPNVKEGGLARNSVSAYQGNLRVFYGYHDDLSIKPEEIPIFEVKKKSVDEQDIFTKDDIEAMREVIDNPRNRCIFEMLLNTGQRITALRTIRLKDIDLDKGRTGCFRLNRNADGLKGAEKTGEWKPLMGAKPAVREWLKYHPCSDDPEAYLITHIQRYPGESNGDKLTAPTINRKLAAIVEEAGVNKPSNAHNFRHTAATMLKRDYNQDNDFIRWFLGHGQDSSVFETTYSHLSDEDYRKQGEMAAGFREREKDNPLTPALCPTCDARLDDDDVACSKCGELFGPGEDAQETVDDLSFKGMREADDESEADAVEVFREFLKDNPEKAVEILQDVLE